VIGTNETLALNVGRSGCGSCANAGARTEQMVTTTTEARVRLMCISRLRRGVARVVLDALAIL
jgi:hypothetical protein